MMHYKTFLRAYCVGLLLLAGSALAAEEPQKITSVKTYFEVCPAVDAIRCTDILSRYFAGFQAGMIHTTRIQIAGEVAQKNEIGLGQALQLVNTNAQLASLVNTRIGAINKITFACPGEGLDGEALYNALKSYIADKPIEAEQPIANILPSAMQSVYKCEASDSTEAAE